MSHFNKCSSCIDSGKFPNYFLTNKYRVYIDNHWRPFVPKLTNYCALFFIVFYRYFRDFWRTILQIFPFWAMKSILLHLISKCIITVTDLFTHSLTQITLTSPSVTSHLQHGAVWHVFLDCFKPRTSTKGCWILFNQIEFINGKLKILIFVILSAL